MFVHLIGYGKTELRVWISKVTWNSKFSGIKLWFLTGRSFKCSIITFSLPAFLIVHLLQQSNIHSCKWDSECFKRQWLLCIGEGKLSFALRLCQAHRSMSKHGDRLCGGGGWRRMRESEKGWAKDEHCCLSTLMDIHPSCSENTHTLTLAL